jgi:hypothetical protein
MVATAVVAFRAEGWCLAFALAAGSAVNAESLKAERTPDG